MAAAHFNPDGFLREIKVTIWGIIRFIAKRRQTIAHVKYINRQRCSKAIHLIPYRIDCFCTYRPRRINQPDDVDLLLG